MATFIIDDYMMTAGLKLTGSELLVFALIFSYTRNNQTLFCSEDNLAKRFGLSRRQIGRVITNLQRRDLIVRLDRKHPGLQSYDYSVNMEKVRQIVPGWCDKMSHQGGTKCRTRVGQNVAPGQDKMSHNNKRDINSNNREYNGDISLSQKFSFGYDILNSKWNELVQEPKWSSKSENSLRYAYKKLCAASPVQAYYMMDYTIERGYDRIYAPNKEIMAKSLENEKRFYSAETTKRGPEIQKMLAAMEKIKQEYVNIPTVDCFEVREDQIVIMCDEGFREWVESNLSQTQHLFNWRRSLKISYRIKEVAKPQT